MNIFRQPPFPLEIFYEELDSNTDYLLEIYDDHTFLKISETVTSDVNGEITYELPSYFEKYDESYSIQIYSLDEEDEPDQTVIMDNLYIYRPYLNPLTIGEDLDEIEQQVYVELERSARQIIDSLVGGFYYKQGEIETSGLGTDYLPLFKRTNRINQVYENNVKIYDRLDPVSGQNTYILSPDKTALTVYVEGSYNRQQSKQVRLPIGASDSFMLYGDDYDQILSLTEIKGPSLFPKDWNYTVYGDFGWPVVPQDIKDATMLLMNDIKGGKLDYINKYISEYQTDQFKLKYSDLSLKGSGNLLVDKILENYSIPIYRLGVI
jgi:hypothetical protein